MQGLTPQEKALSLKRARAELAGVFLKDAQHQSNSPGTRYSFAFDALYLYALCASEAPDGLQDHPYKDFLTSGATLLGLSEAEIGRLSLRMDIPYIPVEATEDEVAWLFQLAQKAQARWQSTNQRSGGQS